jgi:hypothetical protein
MEPIAINDFKVTKTDNGILLEAIDYHAKPCLLDNSFLKSLGYYNLKDQNISGLIGLLKDIVKFLEHHATPSKPNHVCGSPNASCDTDCMNAIHDADLIGDTRSAIKDLEKLNSG